MDNEYLNVQKELIAKLEQELTDVDRNASPEHHVKSAIVDYFIDNDDNYLMHIDFIKVLCEQDNSLDYIYNASKEIPIARLINKESNGMISLAEMVELIGDDAYSEKNVKQRMQKIDGQAYFIRKPMSLEDIDEYTKSVTVK